MHTTFYTDIFQCIFYLPSLEGTEAQDCGAAIAFITIQALEHRMER